MSLKILVFLILYISKVVRSYEFLSISDEQIPFTIGVCKLYRQNSAILLYDESEKGKDIARFHFFFFHFYYICSFLLQKWKWQR